MVEAPASRRCRHHAGGRCEIGVGSRTRPSGSGGDFPAAGRSKTLLGGCSAVRSFLKLDPMAGSKYTVDLHRARSADLTGRCSEPASACNSASVHVRRLLHLGQQDARPRPRIRPGYRRSPASRIGRGAGPLHGATSSTVFCMSTRHADAVTVPPHTAKRIFERLRLEHASITLMRKETIVKDYVRHPYWPPYRQREHL